MRTSCHLPLYIQTSMSPMGNWNFHAVLPFCASLALTQIMSARNGPSSDTIDLCKWQPFAEQTQRYISAANGHQNFQGLVNGSYFLALALLSPTSRRIGLVYVCRDISTNTPGLRVATGGAEAFELSGNGARKHQDSYTRCAGVL